MPNVKAAFLPIPTPKPLAAILNLSNLKTLICKTLICRRTLHSGSNETLIEQSKMGYLLLFIISVYLSSLPVAHLSDAPRRQLVVTGDSERIQDETTENSAWFFNVLGV